MTQYISPRDSPRAAAEWLGIAEGEAEGREHLWSEAISGPSSTLDRTKWLSGGSTPRTFLQHNHTSAGLRTVNLRDRNSLKSACLLFQAHLRYFEK